MRRLRAWLASRRLERRVRRGKQTWGRQPDMGVPMHGHMTIEAKVIRADGTVEDLGVISESEI